MKRLSRLLSFGALACAALSAHATSPVVTVTTSEWKTISFEVAEYMSAVYIQPQEGPMSLVFYSGNVVPGDDGKLRPADSDPGKIYLDIPVDDLEYVSFSKMSGVDNALVSAEVKVDVADGKVRLTGVRTPVKVAVWSASGMAEAAMTVTSDTEIDIARFGAGVHIVGIDGTTFKILTK